MNPLVTTVSKSVVGTVDYMWYLNCRVEGVVATPELEVIEKYGEFPNHDFPSDHFPLVVDIV